MQLPKYKRGMGSKPKLKICREPGCGKEYIGHSISKYCEFHRILKNRKRKRYVREYDGIKKIHHKFNYVTKVVMKCELEGCNNEYLVDLYPKQQSYPKYCEEHRNEFKRFQFLRHMKSRVVYYA